MDKILDRKTIKVQVGDVTIGGSAPIVVQSMTNTDTSDRSATVDQILKLAKAGSELVRITVNTEEAASQVPYIREELLELGCNVPLIGDFHYNGHTLLTKHKACAQALAKYRINPGNVGFKEKKDRQFTTMIEQAMKFDKPIRVGVNWGSLDQMLLAKYMDANAKRAKPRELRLVMHDAIVASALESAQLAKAVGLREDRIVLSCKVSSVQDLVDIYQKLSRETNHALHLGLTEAGMGSMGIVSTAAALSILLYQGIGDTIRISLTPKPGGGREEEVVVGQEILQSLGIRSFIPEIVACPGCGRTTSTIFQELAQEIKSFVIEKMPVWRAQYVGVEEMKIAVMGCIVNGPGESKNANIGISLPGTGEQPSAPVFVNGEKTMTLRGRNIANEFKRIVDDYVSKNYEKK